MSTSGSSIYVSIHSGQKTTGTENGRTSNNSQMPWKVFIEQKQKSRLFHHHRDAESTVLDLGDEAVQLRRSAESDKRGQILRILVGHSDLNQQTSLAYLEKLLSGILVSDEMRQDPRIMIRDVLLALQQAKLIRRFDLGIFISVAEDRVRRLARGPTSAIPDEMDYLGYCQSPAQKSTASGKKGFWLSYPNAQQWTVSSRDPYGGLM